jgi:Zn-dependent protease
MEAQLKLGRIFGVQIGLHYSWFLIALLIMFSLGGHFAAVHPEWGGGLIWTLAIISGLLFFAALLVHELSHALVAKARGLPVRSITLFALGVWQASRRRRPIPARSFGWASWARLPAPLSAASA